MIGQSNFETQLKTALKLVSFVLIHDILIVTVAFRSSAKCYWKAMRLLSFLILNENLQYGHSVFYKLKFETFWRILNLICQEWKG